ncbi:MAG: heavy-metal-associated domain-containing protein [Candidatus Geothermarchaeales archaeon]
MKIRGMHCHGCASRLERALERLEQVEAAEANFETESVSVKWTGVTLDRSLIEKAIRRAGFEPV